MLKRIIEILNIPIILLNFGGGIVGGVWLAFLGEWKLIGIGILLLFTFNWILSILMIPGLPLAGIAVYFYKKKNPLGHLFGFISQLYTNILIMGTCILAFLICSNFYKSGIGFGYIPYLLWSWGMALGPWQFFASKEPNNEFSVITIFIATVFYLLFLISIFISPLLGLIILIIFGFVQLILLPIFNMYIAYKMESYQ